MSLLLLRSILLIGITIASVRASVTLQCVFSGSTRSNNYTCTINNAVIKNTDEEIFIVRQHTSGHSDSCVRYLKFSGAATSLSHIPVEFLYIFENLYKLDVRNSNLKTIGKLKYCSNLEYLDVYGNKLTELSTKSISACKNLAIFEIAFNQITEIKPGFLASFPNLVHFSVHGNKIVELKRGALITATARENITLNFNSNPLRRIEGEFNKTQSFANLQFLDCEVEAIDPIFLENFSSTGRINSLLLEGNKCINRELKSITSENAVYYKSFLYKCFDNFSPTEAPLTPPTPPPIGKMDCRIDDSKKFFICETKVELNVVQ